MNRGESAVDWRVIILNAGGAAEESRFEIANEVDQLIAFDCFSGELGERARQRDRQRGRAAEAGAARRVGARRDLKSGEMKIFERAIDQRRFWIGGDVLQ